MVRLIFLETTSLNRGENQVLCRLPNEAAMGLIDWMSKNRVSYNSQAWTQIGILYLHEHGFIPDEDLNAIRERTKVFRTTQEMKEEKMIQYKKTIEQKETVEISIPRRDLEYLQRTISNLQALPLQEFEQFIPGYYEKAKQYLPHPTAKKCIDLLNRVTQQKKQF